MFLTVALKLKSAVEHIKQRHWYHANAVKTSRFNKSMTVEKLNAIVSKTINRGSFSLSKNGSGNHTYTYSFNKPVGATWNGKRVNSLRVVTKPSGQVVTAYPVR